MNNVLVGQKIGTARVKSGAWAEGEGAYLKQAIVTGYGKTKAAVGEITQGYKEATKK